MAPLDTTFSFTKVNDFPIIVSHHLKLDVAWILKVFFNIDIRGAKASLASY
jgi:hypothetical protein